MDYDVNTSLDQIRKIKSMISLLQDAEFEIDEFLYEKYWTLYTWPNKLKKAIQEAKRGTE